MTDMTVLMICQQVLVLDGIFFFKLLPLYKQYFRGPTHPFEHLEEELKSKAGWPPIGDCKNNEIKIGEFPITVADTDAKDAAKICCVWESPVLYLQYTLSGL